MVTFVLGALAAVAACLGIPVLIGRSQHYTDNVGRILARNISFGVVLIVVSLVVYFRVPAAKDVSLAFIVFFVLVVGICLRAALKYFHKERPEITLIISVIVFVGAIAGFLYLT